MSRTIFILVASFVVTLANECGHGWIKYDNHCYTKPPIEPTDYRNAIDICAAMNSELLTIDSKYEQEFVSRYLVHGETSVWLDAGNSKYDNWFNITFKQKLDKCAVVVTIRRHETKWIREDCEYHNEVVCKSHSNVDPTAIPTTPTTIKPTNTPSTIPTTTLKPTYCPSKWIQFKDKCFWFNEVKTNVENAEKICQTLNAHLASIRSKEENEFLFSAFKKQFPSDWFCWFGAVSFILPTFHWLDGTAFNYTYWLNGHPGSSNKNAFFYPYDNGKWYNDHPPTENWTSICSFYL